MGKQKIKNKRKLKYELSTFYKQKENGKVLFNFFFPREWFYFATQDPGDTTKFDRWQQRVLAEPPTIFNDSLAHATANAMRTHLQRKGYYNADVFPDKEEKGKKVYVTYYVKPNQVVTIDSTFFYSKDTKINRILNEIKDQTLLTQGTGLEKRLYDQEKERITRYLQNHGYANFYPNYFAQLEADTINRNNQANLYIQINPPYEDTAHVAYTIGNISIFPNYSPTVDEATLRDTLIDSLIFKTINQEFNVKPEAIANAVKLRKGELYSQEAYDLTDRKLWSLGVFSFVRVKKVPDLIDPTILHFRIELSPNLKLEFGMDFELNYTNRSGTTGSGNLVGISVSPSFRNRNFLNGAELLVTNISAGVEINPNFSDDRFWNTVDLGIQSDLYFPKFTDYLGVWKLFNRIKFGKKKKLISDQFFNLMKENAATRLSASYNYLLILDWYRYNLFNASYGFDFQKSNTHRYIINHIGIDYLQPFTAPDFEALFDDNPFLARSFGEQLFVSLLFRDLSYVYNGRQNEYGVSKYLGFNIEIAGTEVWAGNKIYNTIFDKSDKLRIGNIDFSQYAKLEIDFRRYKQIANKPQNKFVSRFYFGIARPFGFTSDVPYVKQFFGGGPNGIRAWAPRGLGPGGYVDSLSLNPDNNLRLYQTGDIKLEFNFEYRFDLFWRMKGAIFLDGGNVWTMRRDTSRCGSQFLLSSRLYDECAMTNHVNDPFYKQIALGTGLGLRFDFTYFIFRLDMGIKLRNPFPRNRDNGPISEGDYWESFNKFGLRDVTFNLGFGYPF